MTYLKYILRGIKFKVDKDIVSVRIKKVTDDSRDVGRGDLFIAYRGYGGDGHEFIGEAIAKGARAVVAEKDFKSDGPAVKILVDDTRSALPVLAGNFYGHPSKKMKVVGVTGTNGKTTITYILENILKAAGLESGVMGTINYRFRNKIFPAVNTTPGALEIERFLADLLKAEVRYAVMEVSSHSLDQRRVEGIQFDAAVFTNVTGDHLDYHKTLKNYYKAKVRLIERLKPRGLCILNKDDRRLSSLEGSIKRRTLTYGIRNKADIMAKDLDFSLDGTVSKIVTAGRQFTIKTCLMGRHNVSNILAGIAAAMELGINIDAIKEGVETLSCAPGRLEPISAGQPFKVFVDFAHTSDAIYNVLGLLRDNITAGRIITVFGCGGNRDKKKRPLMGKAACELSDRVIITSDNPRYEEPLEIIEDIEKGIKNRYNNYDIAEDRREAIGMALGLAGENDVVVIAGKGHEKHQIVRGKALPFDDCEVAREILSGSWK